MIVIVIYELTGKFIMILFLMMLFSSYANHLIYHRHIAMEPRSACSHSPLKTRLQRAFIGTASILYWVPFALCFVHWTGANCKLERIYRKVSGLTFSLARVFVLLFVMNWVYCCIVIGFAIAG